MIGGDNFVAAVDVGATKTAAILLGLPNLWDGGGELPEVLGSGLVPTEGVRNQAVTNIEAATASIRQAVREAEDMAGLEVRSVYASLSGTHVEVGGSNGVVAVSDPEVAEEDVDRVHDVARAIALPPDKELVHAIPCDYGVDGRFGIQDPVGMSATRLETQVCVITAGTAVCQNLRKAVDRAGLVTDGLVLGSLATAEAVLPAQERQAGAALIQIGGGATEVIVFKDGRLRLLASYPWGSGTVSNDIVKGLGVSSATAEELKRRHGVARTANVDAGETLQIPGPTPGRSREVSRELLAHIIEQRLDEILGLVYEELAERSLIDDLPAGAVLTGGGAMLDGTLDLAQDVFNMPVRLGAPGAGLIGLVEAVRSPRYATAVGLALYGQRSEMGKGPGMAGRTLARVTDWLRDFF